ncbi:hypothetical protein D3C72_1346700 [compost metagenome]
MVIGPIEDASGFLERAGGLKHGQGRDLFLDHRPAARLHLGQIGLGLGQGDAGADAARLVDQGRQARAAAIVRDDGHSSIDALR